MRPRDLRFLAAQSLLQRPPACQSERARRSPALRPPAAATRARAVKRRQNAVRGAHVLQHVLAPCEGVANRGLRCCMPGAPRHRGRSIYGAHQGTPVNSPGLLCRAQPCSCTSNRCPPSGYVPSRGRRAPRYNSGHQPRACGVSPPAAAPPPPPPPHALDRPARKRSRYGPAHFRPKTVRARVIRPDTSCRATAGFWNTGAPGASGTLARPGGGFWNTAAPG